MFTFNHEVHNGVPVLVISGEIDLTMHSRFRDALQSLDRQVPQLVIDFCRCKYFDSSALNELVTFQRGRNESQRVALSVPHDFARRIFTITNLDRLFPFVECAHAA